MVALHTIFQILAVDMSEVVKVWIVAMVGLANYLSISRSLICANRQGAV